MLFLGREIKSPLLSRCDLSSNDDVAQGMTKQSFWTQAYSNLKAARDKVARRHNANRKPHKYKVGDMFMFKRNLVSSKALNVTSKLLTRWSDPVVIVKFVGINNVLLANSDTGIVIRRVHVSQFKPYVS